MYNFLPVLDWLLVGREVSFHHTLACKASAIKELKFKHRLKKLPLKTIWSALIHNGKESTVDPLLLKKSMRLKEHIFQLRSRLIRRFISTILLHFWKENFRVRKQWKTFILYLKFFYPHHTLSFYCFTKAPYIDGYFLKDT